jgi:hypothetical protein
MAKGIFARPIKYFSDLLQHLVRYGNHHIPQRNKCIHRFVSQGRRVIPSAHIDGEVK